MVLACLVLTTNQVSYWKDSVTLFTEAIEAVPDSYFGYLHRGKEYYSIQAAEEDQRANDEKYLAHKEEAAGHREKAEKHYEEAKKHQQEVLRLWDLAAEDFKAALKINPKYDFGNNNLGVYYANLGQTDPAEEYFRRALAAKEAYSDALGNLCSIYMREGRFADAASCGEKAIRIQEKPTYHLNLGMAYEALRNFDGAKAEFEAAIRCNRNISVSYVKLGMLYAKMGNLAEAEKELEAVTQAAPQDLDVPRDLELVRKARQLDQEVAAGRATADTYGGLGGFQASLGNWAKSASWTEKAIQLQPGNAAYHLNLGVAYKGLRKFDAAEREFKRAIQCDRTFLMPYCQLGIFYAEMGNLEDAEKYLEAVTHAAPQNLDVQKILERVRKTRQLKQEVNAGHATADTYSDLGGFQESFGNWDEAEKCFRKVLQVDPQHPHARQQLEKVRAKRKEAENH